MDFLLFAYIIFLILHLSFINLARKPLQFFYQFAIYMVVVNWTLNSMKKSELQNVLSMFLTFFKSELRCSYKMCSYIKKRVYNRISSSYLRILMIFRLGAGLLPYFPLPSSFQGFCITYLICIFVQNPKILDISYTFFFIRNLILEMRLWVS